MASANGNSHTVSAPADIEATLSRLANNPAVRGILVLSRAKGVPIRSAGALFESDGSDAVQRYAQRAWKLVEAAQDEIEGLEVGDAVRFMRIRTKRHELMVTPDPSYILVVVQDPGKV